MDATGRQAAFRPEGEERDLAVHARRRQPHGELRPEADADQYAGKTIAETPFADVQDPERLKKVRVVVVNDANGQQRNKIYPLQVGFKKYGQSGIEVSDWFPHIGSCVDDIAIVRSMWTTDDNHGAQVQFHSGRHMLDPRVPTIGAWVNYGLGTLNDNLPQFITMGPRFFDTRDGHYLGPAYDSVPLKVDPKNPLDYAKPEGDLTRRGAAARVRPGQPTESARPRDATPTTRSLEARIKSYELAFRMQTAVPEVIDFTDETAGDAEACTVRPDRRRGRSASSCWRPGDSSSRACASSRSCTATGRPARGTSIPS